MLAKRLRSVITDNLDFCIECGRPREHMHHCLYGNKHKQCDEDRLIVPLCVNCHILLHNDNKLSLKYKQMAQVVYENKHSHEEYMKRYGKNYL